MNIIHKSANIIDIDYLSVFTLYGSSVVKHPQFFQLIEYIYKMMPHVRFCLDIGDVVPYDQAYMDMLRELPKKYPIIYVFVRNIDDMALIKYAQDWKDFFSFLAKYPTFLDREPSIRYGKSDYLSLKILSKIFNSIPNPVIPVYAKHPYADSENKKFYSERLGTSTCKYFSYLEKDILNETLIF